MIFGAGAVPFLGETAAYLPAWPTVRLKKRDTGQVSARLDCRDRRLGGGCVKETISHVSDLLPPPLKVLYSPSISHGHGGLWDATAPPS